MVRAGSICFYHNDKSLILKEKYRFFKNSAVWHKLKSNIKWYIKTFEIFHVAKCHVVCLPQNLNNLSELIIYHIPPFCAHLGM